MDIADPVATSLSVTLKRRRIGGFYRVSASSATLRTQIIRTEIILGLVTAL